MAPLKEGLGRAAAFKSSYQELDGDDGPQPPETPVQQRRSKRQAAAETEGGRPQKKQKEQNRVTADSDAESSQEQKDSPQVSSETRRVRIDNRIKELEMAGKDTLIFCDTTPLKTEPELHPPPLDLRLLKLSAAELPFLDDSVLYGYLTSNDFLPCMAQLKKECIDNDQLRNLLLAALPDNDFPFVETTKYLAQTAPKYANIIEEKRTLNHPHAKIILICLKYVRRLKRCIMRHFMHFLRESRYPRLEEFVYMFCTRAMLTFYADLRLHGRDGFFATMLDSRFAEPMTLEARRAWDKLLFLPGITSAANTANSVDTIHAASIAYAKNATHKPRSTPLTPDEIQALQFKALQECWELKNAYITAVAESPELMFLVPPEVGQTELLEARKHEKKADPTTPYKRELEVECDSLCRAKTNLHTRDCTTRYDQAKEDRKKSKGDVEADVPDQEQSPPDYTFQQSVFVPQEHVISRFNQRDVVEPFSDEEKLVAFRRFKLILDIEKGDTIDQAFEWTMISEVLAGRSEADCVRFYYQHKHIIDMRLKPAAGHAVPLVLNGVPEWGPHLDPAVQRKVRAHFDIDRFLQHIAELEAKNTDQRIRLDQLEMTDKQRAHSEKFHRARADRHKSTSALLAVCENEKYEENARLKKQLKAVERQKNEENENLKKQLKAIERQKDEEIESMKKQLAEQGKVSEDRRKFGEWQDSLAEERLGIIEGLKEELKTEEALVKEYKALTEDRDLQIKSMEEQLESKRPTVKQYGEMPEGASFLSGDKWASQKRQWRGEK